MARRFWPVGLLALCLSFPVLAAEQPSKDHKACTCAKHDARCTSGCCSACNPKEAKTDKLTPCGCADAHCASCPACAKKAS